LSGVHQLICHSPRDQSSFKFFATCRRHQSESLWKSARTSGGSGSDLFGRKERTTRWRPNEALPKGGSSWPQTFTQNKKQVPI